jgi:hypothetical protein
LMIAHGSLSADRLQVSYTVSLYFPVANKR